MNVYFAYTIGSPNIIYYGKYFGHDSTTAVSEADLLSAIYPSLEMCYSIQSVSEITISVLSCESTSVFSDRDPFKYNFVYCNSSSTQIYLNGTLMS